jgi:hypothetical protein
MNGHLPVVDPEIIGRRQLEAAAPDEESPPLGPQHLAGVVERQVRESVAHREHAGWTD